MKKYFLLAIGLIVSIVFFDRALAWCLDSIYPQIQSGGSGGDINYFLGLEKEVDFLIMGNSRAHHHIIPDSFGTNAYNLSHNGMALSFQAGLISVINSKGKMPKQLLLQIEPSFFFNRSKLDEKDAQFLKAFYGKDELVTTYINRLSRYERIKYFFNLYRYNGKLLGLLLNYFRPKERDSAFNGFESIAYNLKDTIQLNIQIKRLEKLNTSERINEVVNAVAASYIEDIIKICEKSNTRLVFFTAPYFMDKNSLSQIKALKKFFTKKGLLYLNYTEVALPSLNDKRLWMDMTHLNIEGAKILTSDLKARQQSKNR